MKLICFRKSDLNNQPIIMSEKWISNGHWAVLKVLVTNDFCDETTIRAFANIADFREMTDKQMERVFPKNGDLRLKATNRLVNNTPTLNRNSDFVVFEGEFEDKPVEVLFNRRYCELLGLYDHDLTLVGTGIESPFMDEDKTRVIMPVRSR